MPLIPALLLCAMYSSPAPLSWKAGASKPSGETTVGDVHHAFDDAGVVSDLEAAARDLGQVICAESDEDACPLLRLRVAEAHGGIRLHRAGTGRRQRRQREGGIHRPIEDHRGVRGIDPAVAIDIPGVLLKRGGNQ